MLLVDLATLLDDGGHGTAGTDLFVSGKVDDPDTITVLYEYVSSDIGQVFGGETHEVSNVQVLSRAGTYAAANTRVTEAVGILLNGGNGYVVQRHSTIFELRVDDRGRHEHVCNLRVWHE